MLSLQDWTTECMQPTTGEISARRGFQEYVAVPQRSVYKIPDQLSWEEAVMIEPFTIAEQTCWRAGLTSNDTVFIMGAGPVGLSILKRAKIFGVKCIVSDVVDCRLQMALAFGADAVIHAAQENVLEKLVQLTDGQKPSVVIDAVCTVKSFEQTLDYVCSAGRIITLGFHASPSAITQLSITAREIDIRGSRLHNNKFPEVIELFASGKLQVKEMITHQFPFEKIREAIALIEDTTLEKGKVILQF
jgi:L-gulonate 5-dehydrogenase